MSSQLGMRRDVLVRSFGSTDGVATTLRTALRMRNVAGCMFLPYACTPSAPWLEEVGAASMALHSSQANP